ncbi:DNA repair protein RadA [Candidatus Cyanaurora vandensis]|uniref:DNA repair protein RadA n=1 Tax=Candidatus Cyanaurora vandensis TaxID=2714958 RepID=UPI00257B1CEE|nr:DNA repair protein RadA [Candidatus Cyanaurora vandensis]
MPKIKTLFQCTNCGAESPRWLGRCADCGEWNTYVEQIVAPAHQPTSRKSTSPAQARSITQVSQEKYERLDSGYNELNRVLGGGIVPGSLVLVGGEPGAGKSTLLLQVAQKLAQQHPTLYLSGEESVQQVKLRADRLQVTSPELYLLAETDLEIILRELEQLKPRTAIIDSIQSVYLPTMTSAPGSVSQVRECTAALMRVAKREGISLLIVGHVTKEGAIAGPKVLEHLVDTVLYFEGDRFQSYRLLRSVKNRFGATHELGVFEMTGAGLVEVDNPSQLFLSNREDRNSGTAVIVSCEGTRPLVVEVQALVSPTSYTSPRRTVTGLEYNRFLQILAVLEKRVGIPLSKLDAYVSSVGGMTVNEPAADLGVALAVAASFRDRLVDPYTVILGEVGLGGQVRPVPQLELRLREAVKLGFTRAIVPRGTLPEIPGLTLIGVSRVLEALIAALPETGDEAKSGQ